MAQVFIVLSMSGIGLNGVSPGMNDPDQLAQEFSKAQSLHGQGRLPEAEAVFRRLLDADYQAGHVLQSLAQLYMQSGRLEEAAKCLQQLVDTAPDKISYYDLLADLFTQMGRMDEAIACYQRFLQSRPDVAEAHFNLALIQRKSRRFDEALKSYQRALELGIDRPEEVHSNMSVVFSELRREEQAINSLETALQINRDYMPAMFNLANRREEAGDKQAALGLFQRIIDQDPQHYEALARLADVVEFTDPDDPVIRKMKRAIRKLAIDPQVRIDLYFALGKALNDCSAYDDAFLNYQKANDCASKTMEPYDRAGQEALTDQLIETFSADWFDRIKPVSEAAPIFICGMLRSGSTLIEQVLASHPTVTAGGEIDFFFREVQHALAPFPESVLKIKPKSFEALAEAYLAHLQKTFPEAENLTDKRPDNFPYLGLIRTLFPNARIICTVRKPLDNCLSVYFQQLARAANYATRLEDTAHYFTQYKRLMAHWRKLFGGNIFDLSYDDFVKEPRPVLEKLLDFCGLEWSDNCLEFYKADNFVKTASVWQVRQPLYQKSSGRWRNYQDHISPLRNYLEQAGVII
jgi:tetratricopeptide (TPR) repeat protein